MVGEFFLKWGLSLITGALGSLLISFRKEIGAFLTFKRNKKKKELLKEVKEDISDLGDQMTQHEVEVEKEICKHDKLYMDMMQELKKEIMDILIPIQKATLSSHYQALLDKCKYYIRQNEITADELDLLERDYETYAALGGNGHMELWMTRVRKLPVK